MKIENPIVSFFKTQYSKKNIRVLQPIRLFLIRLYVYRKKFIWSFDEDERRLLVNLQRLESHHKFNTNRMYYDHMTVYRQINNYLLENATKEQKIHVQKMWLERHDKAQSKYHWNVWYDYEHSDHYS